MKRISFISSDINLPEGCMAFGTRASKQNIHDWICTWRKVKNNFDFFLVLAGSRTAEVKGISAAGSTSYLRRYTALADAEFLLNGPLKKPTWPLPHLPAGVSPALISYVGKQWLDLHPLVISVGLDHQPDFPHLSLEPSSFGPAQCLSNGNAMEINRVKQLLGKAYEIGKRASTPLLITECVPGGTSTAQAVMTGLGLHVDGLMGSSVKTPPIALKRQLVKEGLTAANLGANPLVEKLIAAVGDPFQPVAVGLLLGARKAGQQVLLGGGSQMLAVLALALSNIKETKERFNFLEGVSIATTNWLTVETDSSKGNKSSFLQLVTLLEEHFQLEILGFASGLNFLKSTKKVLRDYEDGYVKEGVGAGAISFLAQINGASCIELLNSCEQTIDQLSALSNK